MARHCGSLKDWVEQIVQLADSDPTNTAFESMYYLGSTREWYNGIVEMWEKNK